MALPAMKHSSILRVSSAGIEEEYGRVMPRASMAHAMVLAVYQRLTLVHFRAQLEDLRDTSLTSELNLRTFGTHRSCWSST